MKSRTVIIKGAAGFVQRGLKKITLFKLVKKCLFSLRLSGGQARFDIRWLGDLDPLFPHQSDQVRQVVDLE
ncbi:hypothetical protein MalM14_51670 [Gimesia chilikensis]|nr:hypothetical protein MalM14_51670 [Gimesia chilikensis]